MKNIKTQDFIEKSRKVHGDKYDYSKVNYINAITKVKIICPKHGEFEQTPNTHLNGCGCPKCNYLKSSLNQRSNTQEFINKAKLIHGDKYDYSKVEYINWKTHITIICPKHGQFEQTPNSHLNGCGCPKCKGGVKYTQEEFIQKSKEIHGDKYDYSKVEYKNAHTKVCIICSKHGEFYQTPDKHLHGQGCRKCKNSTLEKDINDNFDNLILQKTFDWLKFNRKLPLDFFIQEKNIAIECQGLQHFTGKWRNCNKEDIFIRDKIKFELCKEHNIEIIYYFPKEFLNYDISNFYNDKKCFHNINDLKKYIENGKH